MNGWLVWMAQADPGLSMSFFFSFLFVSPVSFSINVCEGVFMYDIQRHTVF